MIAEGVCPERSDLEGMLEGTLPPADQTVVSLHLERCATCQTKFEELAGAGRLVPEGPLAGDGQEETALLRVMERLVEGRADAGGSEATGGDDAELPFLAPSDKPDCLGQLGPYEILGIIGRGGMGVVLKGRDPRLNRFVAIKVLAPQLAAYSGARKRFLREAQAAAALNHQHVVTIHAVDEFNGFPYIVMEYVVGLSLAEKIVREKGLSLQETLRIGSQIAAGLAAAHGQRLIHRDIKPANILLEGEAEKVKITDFGLARAAGDAQITHSGQVTGTPEYMSPEQARGESLDHRSDLFSLGCVLYAMCSGESPFRAKGAWDAIGRVCNEAPRSLRALNRETPDWLIEIIDRLLAKNPDERFLSASEVGALLEWHLAEQRVMPEGLTRRLRPASRRWKPRTIAAVALLAAIPAAFGIYEIVIRLHRDGRETVIRVEPGSEVNVHGKDVEIRPPNESTSEPKAGDGPGRLADSGSAQEVAIAGWRLWQKGEYEASVGKFERALAIDPKHENAWNGLGWAKFHLGELGAGRDAFYRALALNPDLPGALNGLGQIALVERKYDEAEKYLLKASPNASATWYGLVRIYLLQGKYAEAEKWGRKLVDSGQADEVAKQMLQAAKDKRVSDELRQIIEPPKNGNATALVQQGWVLWQKGDMGEAIKKFEQAVKIDPKNANSWNGLGWANFNSGNTPAAETAFQKAVAIAPSHPAARNGLGQIRLMKRQYDEAEKEFLKAGSVAPAAWYGLARLYLLQGKYEQAEKWAKKVIDSGQGDEGARLMLQAARDKRLSEELRHIIEPPTE